MVHPVAEDDPPPASFTHLREVWHELCDPQATPETKLRAVFDRETEAFGLSSAFLSHIDVDAGQQRFDVVAGRDESITAGESVPLSDSYCRKTVEVPDGTMAISDAVAEGWDDHPAYEDFGIRTYLGASVEVDGELYGTLGFTSCEGRADAIVDREVALVDMLAEWAGYEIAVREGTSGDATLAPGTETGPSLWSSEVDDVMDALARRPRRVVLAGLLEGWVDTQADVLDAAGWDAGEVTTLEHNHLPRLDDAGFVEWDRETGAIDRGAAFDDLEATLQCVVDAVEEVDEVHR